MPPSFGGSRRQARIHGPEATPPPEGVDLRRKVVKDSEAR